MTILLPSTCANCPLARHLDGTRFVCADTDKVVRAHFPATAECHQAILEREAWHQCGRPKYGFISEPDLKKTDRISRSVFLASTKSHALTRIGLRIY